LFIFMISFQSAFVSICGFRFFSINSLFYFAFSTGGGIHEPSITGVFGQ
jgi:hypothetical protein